MCAIIMINKRIIQNILREAIRIIMKKLLFLCVLCLMLEACGAKNEAPPAKDESSIVEEESVTEDTSEKEIEIMESEETEQVDTNDDIKEPVYLPVSCIAYDGTEIYYTDDYYYDDNNRLIKTVRTNNNGDSPITIFKATYDEKGNQTELYTKYMIGYMDVMTWGYFDYSYDEKGEWISRAYRSSEDEIPNPDSIQHVENIYNDDGLIIRRNISEDYHSEFSYPEDGSKIENGYFQGNLVDEFSYDRNGKLVFYSDNSGADWKPLHVFKFEYDKKGNLSHSYKWSSYYIKTNIEEVDGVGYVTDDVVNEELVEDYSIENIYDSNDVLAAAHYSSQSDLPDLTLIYNYEGYENTIGMDIASNPQNKGIDGIFEDGKDTYICDDQGNKIASYSKGDFSAVLAHADGYYLLLKVDSGFEGFTEKIGLLKNDGSWISEYVTVDNFGLEKYAEDNVDTRICDEVTGSYGYLGGGVFYYAKPDYLEKNIHIINAEGQKEYNIENLYYQMGVEHENVLDESVFAESDYAAFMVHESKRIGLNVYSKDGLYDEYIDHVFDLGLTNIGGFNKVEDGGFIYWLDDGGETKCIIFYDIESKTSTILYDDVKHINKNRLKETHFENGKCILYLHGNDNKEYYAVVDKKGTMLVEPQTDFPNLN